MKRPFIALFAALGIAQAVAAPAPRYAVLGAASGPDGSFDYVSVDAPSGRVYVGRAFGVQVLDKGRLTTLLRRKGVAAVLPIETRLMLSTNGDQNDATLFDRFSGRVLADIPTGKEPDGATYDAASHRAFVMNGESRDVSVIDVDRRRAVAHIPMPGAPEGAVADGKGTLFVNLEDRNAIAVVDTDARRVKRLYALPGCDEPTGIARDPVTGLLISACHNGVAKLIEARTGRDRGTIRIGQGADGVLFDADRRIGFVPCIDGTLTVFRLERTGVGRPIQTLTTRNGARTAAYDAQRDKIYLATAKVERDGKGNYLRAERQFAILTVGRTGSR
jgi:DNA-binding beta-propeller fold protein YncE